MKNIVLVDIDGTISNIGERVKYLKQSPKDYDSFYNDCFEDEPIVEIIELVKLLSKKYDIVFCTGRRETVRKFTISWIIKHFGYSFAKDYTLLMRSKGDQRSDAIVKPELTSNAGILLQQIAFVIEDRSVMVKKWRSLGLICLQVAEGNF